MHKNSFNVKITVMNSVNTTITIHLRPHTEEVSLLSTADFLEPCPLTESCLILRGLPWV